MKKIEIPRRNRSCTQGKESLMPEMEYCSILLEAPKGELQRQDYCMACWEQIAPGHHTFWKSKIPPKVEPKTAKERDDRALDLLKEGADKAEMFVLALYLVRKKRLAWRQEMIREEDSATFDLYEDLETEEMHAVPKISLTEIETDKVQRVLAEKLKYAHGQ